MHHTLKITAPVLLASTIAISGCAGDPHQRAKAGAVIGAIAGGVLGHQVDGDKGRYIGAALGAIGGAAAGNYMDEQQRELERRLAEEQRNQTLQITRLPDGSLKVGIASEASFDVDSSEVRAEYRGTFSKISSVLSEFQYTAVHVLGHTDSTGTEAYNQALSERRAANVGGLLSRYGVDAARIQTEGRGELQPIASNTTSEGRKQNRRVELFIKPIVKGKEDEAFQRPRGPRG